MIIADAPKTATLLTDGRVLPIQYTDPTPAPSFRQFSEPAQQILSERLLLPKNQKLPDNMPEVTALRILDLLSSKQGYIRRKGRSFRTVQFYEAMLPRITAVITSGKPFVLSAICLSPNFTNQNLCGKSPYPHMASYIALENLHKVADALRLIYAPGAQFVLGFEGYLVQPIYFHSDQVLRGAQTVFTELNDIVHSHLHNSNEPNPVTIVDARWMVEQAFGNMKAFDKHVAEQAKTIPETSLVAWQNWYETVVPAAFFPSEASRKQFIQDKSRWRAAVRSFHYKGGLYAKGFVGFSEEAIPFSPAGRQASMLALQLVPENSFLPHQRAITFEPQKRRWRMMAYEEIASCTSTYVPRFVRNYSYPFYYEKVESES